MMMIIPILVYIIPIPDLSDFLSHSHGNPIPCDSHSHWESYSHACTSLIETVFLTLLYNINVKKLRFIQILTAICSE